MKKRSNEGLGNLDNHPMLKNAIEKLLLENLEINKRDSLRYTDNYDKNGPYRKDFDRNEQSNYYKIQPIDLIEISQIIENSNGVLSSKEDFINMAIHLMILFWTKPGPSLNREMSMIWKILPQNTKDYVKSTSKEYYEIMESSNIGTPTEQALNSFIDFQQKIKLIRKQGNKIEFPSSSVDWPGEKFQLDITRKPIPILSDTYDRIFPMKLVLLLLASNIIKSMNISKSIFVNYQDFRDGVFIPIKNFSNYLRIKEKEAFADKSVDRTLKVKTKKITVSLPCTDIEDEQISKISENSIRNDFLAKYVGPTIRAWKSTIDKEFADTQCIYEDELYRFGYLTGMLSDLGLVKFRQSNRNSDEIFITLTKRGLEFLTLKNPILDENNFERTLSIEESKFFRDELISQKGLELEKEIVESIMIEASQRASKNEDKISNEVMSQYLGVEEINNIIIKSITDYYEKRKPSSDIEKEFLESIQYDIVKINPKLIVDLKEKSTNKVKLTEDEDNIWKRYIDFEKWLESYRISLMGRLSETRLVIWDIFKNKSWYRHNPDFERIK